jgi:hypothetical protein
MQKCRNPQCHKEFYAKPQQLYCSAYCAAAIPDTQKVLQDGAAVKAMANEIREAEILAKARRINELNRVNPRTFDARISENVTRYEPEVVAVACELHRKDILSQSRELNTSSERQRFTELFREWAANHSAGRSRTSLPAVVGPFSLITDSMRGG